MPTPTLPPLRPQLLLLPRLTSCHSAVLLLWSLLVLFSLPLSSYGQSADDGFNLGANSLVSTVAVQADGKLVVGGLFTTLGGQPRSSIGRLNPDGTLDTAFNPGGVIKSAGGIQGVGWVEPRETQHARR